LSDHNEQLSGDVLTQLTLNYEWRRFLSNALQRYADSIIIPYDKDPSNDDADLDDYRNQWQALIDDLYSEDIVLTDPASITMYRNSNQSISANTATPISWNVTINTQGLTLWSSGTPTKFTIPTNGEGYYMIQGTVQFPTTVAAQVKSVRIVVNNLTVWITQTTILLAVSIPISFGLELEATDEIEIEVFCPVAFTLPGNDNGAVCVAIARLPEQI